MKKHTSAHSRTSTENARRRKFRKASSLKSPLNDLAKDLSRSVSHLNPNMHSVYFGNFALTVDVSHHSEMAEDYTALADKLGIIVENMTHCAQYGAVVAACSSEDTGRDARAVAGALEGVELLCGLMQALRGHADALNHTAAGSTYSQRGHSA